MNRADIIRMAREAYGDWYPNAVPHELERFAALIAAAEREAMKWDGIHTCHDDCQRPPCVAVRKAVQAEREAILAHCEAVHRAQAGYDLPPDLMQLMDFIRARGKK